MRKDLLLVQKELRPGVHLSRSWLAIAAVALILFAAAALDWRFHIKFTLSSSDTLVLADMNNQTGDAALGDGMSWLCKSLYSKHHVSISWAAIKSTKAFGSLG